MKALIAKLFILLGWTVFIEELLCDVLACRIKKHPRRLVGGEADRSTRNIVQNVSRDFCRGCDVVLVVVTDEALRLAVSRKLNRALPRKLRTRVAVMTIARVERTIKRLESSRSAGAET